MPSRLISDCSKDLQTAWVMFHSAFVDEFPGWELILTCTHRTPEEQFRLFKEGREKDTNGRWMVVDERLVKAEHDGFKLLSKHNDYPARAFDVAVVRPDGTLERSITAKPWQSLAQMAKRFGLVSFAPVHFDHFELV